MLVEGTNGKGTVKIDHVDGVTSTGGGTLDLITTGRKIISCWIDNSYSSATINNASGQLYGHANGHIYCYVKDLQGTAVKGETVRVWYAYIDE